MDELFRDGYKAIFIGTGVWQANTPGIKCESFGHVHYAINYLNYPDVYKQYPAGSIIISISQGPQNTIVRTTTGLEANSRGLLIADECSRTSRPGIFASGDAVNGARTVVEAVAHSKQVAAAMHEYIQQSLAE